MIGAIARRLRYTFALLGALALAGCSTAGNTPAQIGPTTAKQPGALSTGGAATSGAAPRTMGDASAPITVVEYSDFQCPFCARFAHDTQGQLKQAYIDTGKVRFIYRDLPLTDIHPGALLAAHVANCAGEQGSFWPMHDKLFNGAALNAWGKGDSADLALFMRYVAALHLDPDKLQGCVKNNQFAAQIQGDMRDAAALGIHSTPTFVVNGQLLVGAQPFEVWQQVLDDLLAQR